MAHLKKMLEKIVLIIVMISLLISFCAMPSAYAKLDMQDGEFYYAGTQKGQYTVHQGIFAWLLSHLGDIADWILGIITMGFRMVFVGWTALIEKLLTWTLESTSGITASGDVVESSTDLTSITDSTQNVTIEAIVYNHVKALDANLFKTDIDVEDLVYAGTGYKLRCKKCNTDVDSDVTACCSTDGTCSCECGGKCEGCAQYIKAVKNYNLDDDDDTKAVPIITQVKKAVATWYYVIRTLALAAMLVILIAVGIKMAISTIADEKAKYKRMLQDWLVGLILIFSIHYIMLFTIYINEELVKLVEDTAKHTYTAKMMELAENDSQNGVEYTHGDMEMKVYEEIRTRAYDAKLVNGMTGVIMYMTLVYFAIRYTIIYVKRLFTLIVLTIMSPAIGLGYAVQKVVSGKQQSLKIWMAEYILNVMMQVMHAIIYAVFISEALFLSLKSISGIIVALILMNYSLKAFELLKKIFKIQGGAGFSEDTNKAAENLAAFAKEAYVGGQTAKSAFMNTPYSKGVKAIGKTAAAIPFAGAAAISSAAGKLGNALSSSSDDDNSGSDSTPSDSDTSSDTNANDVQDNSSGKSKARSEEELAGVSKTELKSNLDIATDQMKKAKTKSEKKEALEKFAIASEEYNKKLKSEKVGSIEAQVARAAKLVDSSNFRITRTVNKKGNAGSIRALLDTLSSTKGNVFGNTYRDSKTGKKVNDGTGFYNQLSPYNFLGITKEEKKMYKDQAKLLTGSVLGLGAVFAGMGMIVVNPKVGMALLAGGGSKVNSAFGKKYSVAKDYKGKYAFNRFSSTSLKNIEKQAVKKARKELAEMKAQDLKVKHPNFYKSLKVGKVVAYGGLTVGTILAAPLVVPALAVKKYVVSTNIGDALQKTSKYVEKQEKAQEKEFKKETLTLINVQNQARMAYILNEADDDEVSEVMQEQDRKAALYEIMGYNYNAEDGTVELKEDSADQSILPDVDNSNPDAADDTDSDTSEDSDSVDDKFKDIFKKDESQEESTDISEKYEKILDQKLKKAKLVDDDSIVKETASEGFSEEELKAIDTAIEKAIMQSANGSAIDFNSEKTMGELKAVLTTILTSMGILKKDENINTVFKSSEVGLKRTLKRKAKIANLKIEAATQVLSEAENTPSDKAQTQVEPKAKGEAQKAMNTKKKRKKKLQQVLELSFDTSTDDPAGELIAQIENSTKSGKGAKVTASDGTTLELSSEESAKALELLFLRKELEEVNRVAKEELEITKGSYKYNQAVKQSYNAASEYYADELKRQKYALENKEIYQDKDYASKTDKYSQTQIEERKKIETLEGKLNAKKATMRKKEREIDMIGPIVNLNDVKNSLITNNK